MDSYGLLLEKVLYPVWEQSVRKRNTFDRLAFLRSTERKSLDELQALQSGALRRLIEHAYREVPFYRARLDAAAIVPSDIRTLFDLPRIPILTREEARATPEERQSPFVHRATISKTTGGTTGQPLLFAYDENSEHWRQAVKLRSYGWAGYRLGARTFHYWGAPTRPLPPLTRRFKIATDRFLKREHYMDCTARSDQDLRAAARAIERGKPRTILCYTQAGADLARFIVANDLRRWDSIAVLCCAEALYAADREALSAAFGEEVFETYGCREVMLVGSECEAHDGLHTSMENLIVEVLVKDGEGERPAEPGESGDVVLTDLHNYGMPFIRYKNGDVAVMGKSDRCSCGRTLLRLARVDGRSADTLRDAKGGRVSGLVFNLIFSVLAESVRQFQAVQHKDGSITLKLIPSSTITDVVRNHIAKNCEKYLPGVPIRTEIVEEIPTSPSGKRQVVMVE